MNFPTMWYFDMNRLEPVQLPFKLRNSKNHHRIFKRLAKVLIRLCAFAGWSEPLLVEHTTLLQISCRGSFLTIILKHNYSQVKCDQPEFMKINIFEELELGPSINGLVTDGKVYCRGFVLALLVNKIDPEHSNSYSRYVTLKY